jgi:hypothetical protein
MLPTFFGRHDDPWWLSRPAVLAALMLGVVAPTLVPRSLRAVAKFSSFSVCMLFVLATSIASLAAVALATGKVAPGVRLLPDAAVLGPSPLEAAANVLSIVSGERLLAGRPAAAAASCLLLLFLGTAAVSFILLPFRDRHRQARL